MPPPHKQARREDFLSTGWGRGGSEFDELLAHRGLPSNNTAHPSCPVDLALKAIQLIIAIPVYRPES